MPQIPFSYPVASFHYVVNFSGLSLSPNDIGFQSVSGLEVKIETETIKEGGQNVYDHVVPTRRKFSDLVLKRGVITQQPSAITTWFRKAMEGENFGRSVEPQDLVIMLLNDKHFPLMAWKIYHAWPLSWKYSDLNAEKGELLIETMTLNYNRYTIEGGF